jgi:hypothetical protein
LITQITAFLAREFTRFAISVEKSCLETAAGKGISRPRIIISLSDIRCWAQILFFFVVPYSYDRALFWTTSSFYFRIEAAAITLTSALMLWILLHPVVLMTSPSYYYSRISPSILSPIFSGVLLYNLS